MKEHEDEEGAEQEAKQWAARVQDRVKETGVHVWENFDGLGGKKEEQADLCCKANTKSYLKAEMEQEDAYRETYL
jgi:hypothetical protein